MKVSSYTHSARYLGFVGEFLALKCAISTSFSPLLLFLFIIVASQAPPPLVCPGALIFCAKFCLRILDHFEFLDHAGERVCFIPACDLDLFLVPSRVSFVSRTNFSVYFMKYVENTNQISNPTTALRTCLPRYLPKLAMFQTSAWLYDISIVCSHLVVRYNQLRSCRKCITYST